MSGAQGEWRAAGAAFAAGLALRVVAAGMSGGLSHDAAAYYLPNARALATGGLGNWDGMTIAVPPLFPTLVALLGAIVPDLEVAALAISVVAGAAIVFPVAGLAARFLPSEPLAGRIAVWIAAVHPYLVRFSGDARADALYALCFALALWLGFATLDAPQVARGAAFGLVVGIAYLLRPEALGLPLLLAVSVLVVAWRRRGTAELAPYRRGVIGAGVAGALLLAPALAWNMAFVHHKVGLWTLSPKAGILLDYDKLGMGDTFSPLNADKTMTLYEEKLTRPEAYRDFSPWESLRANPSSIVRSVLRNIGAFYEDFAPAMGVIPTVAFLAGALLACARGERGGLGAMLAIIGFYSLALCLFYESKRFWVPLLPLFFPWCGLGVARAWRRFGAERPFPKWGWAVLLALILVQTAHRWPANGWWQSQERTLGARLLERYGEGQVYASRKGIVTWHARGRHVWLPSRASIDDVFSYTRHRQARFVVLEGGSRPRDLPPLWQEIVHSPRFREVDRAGEGTEGIVVYERL